MNSRKEKESLVDCVNDVKNKTLVRILSAIVGLPLYIFAFTTDYLFSTPILVVSIVISLVSLYEYYTMCERDNVNRPFVLIGLLAGLVANGLIYLSVFGEAYGYNRYLGVVDARVIIAFSVIFVSIILILQLFIRPIKGGIYSLAVTTFGVFFIVFSFSHIILMKALADGLYYIIIINIVVMINDSGAYFGGILLGRHKTNFEVSPNKSWEGYISGLIFSILAMIITNEVLKAFYNKNLFTLIESIIIGILLSILGHIGDLIESAIKRDSTRKDSGRIIPGHGGMWDVFDALIFTFPFFYYYLVMKGVK